MPTTIALLAGVAINCRQQKVKHGQLSVLDMSLDRRQTSALKVGGGEYVEIHSDNDAQELEYPIARETSVCRRSLHFAIRGSDHIWCGADASGDDRTIQGKSF